MSLLGYPSYKGQFEEEKQEEAVIEKDLGFSAFPTMHVGRLS